MTRSVVGKNIFYMALVQCANYIVPLVMLPYLSRVIGVDGVGVLAMALSVCAIAVIFTDFGFAISSTVWIAKNKDKWKLLEKYVTAIFCIKIIFIFIISIAIFIYTTKFGTDENKYKVMGVIVSATVFFQAFQCTWFFQGLENMKNITICTVTTKMSYLFLVVVFVKSHGDEVVALICFCISNLISTALYLYLMKHEGFKFRQVSKLQIFKIFKDNLPFFYSRVAVGIYSNASTFIVGSQAGVRQAAFYSSSEKLYQASISLTSPISQSLYPHLAKTKDIKTLIKFMAVLLPLMVIGVIICVINSTYIITLIYGQDFQSGSEIFKYFIVISVISFISINFGYPAYSTIDRLDIVNKSVILGGVIQLLLLGVLYLTTNINGLNVVKSLLISESCVCMFRVFMFYRTSMAMRLVK